jgi:hypothetical protein
MTAAPFALAATRETTLQAVDMVGQNGHRIGGQYRAWQPPVPPPDSPCHITGDSTLEISRRPAESKLPLGCTSLFDALSADQFTAAERAAKLLNMQPRALKLENPPYDMAATFGSAAAGGAQMVLVLSSPLFIPHHRQIAESAAHHRMPTMFINRSYVEAGGLMSYGVNFPAMYHRGADYVVKVFKGTKPR